MSTPLSGPDTLSLLITISNNQENINHGTINDDVFLVLRKLFNPALKGLEWDAVLSALATGDSINWENAKLALNQLTVASASGIYLDKRASDLGLERPDNVGMSDDLFRRLCIILNSEQLTQQSVLDVLEVFYGKDAVCAEITSDVSETYRLQDLDDLRFILDEKEDITVVFKREEFSKLGEATAQEVAAAITRACINIKSQGYAIAIKDTTTGLSKVRIYSAKSGLSSSVRVLGGRAQRILQFPESIFTTSGVSPFAVWTIALSPTTEGNIRFTETSGIYDLTKLIAGDLAYIYGDEFSSTDNTGVFEVEKVSVEYTPGLVQWFEIANPTGTAGVITQILFENLMFFRPVRHTLYDQPRRVIVAQTGPGLNIEIPATTLAVGRTAETAAYLNPPTQTDIIHLERFDSEVTATTAFNHNLSPGDQIFVDGAEPDVELVFDFWRVTPPTTTSGTASPDFSLNVASGTTKLSKLTTLSEAHTFQAIYHKVLRLPEGLLMVLGGESQSGGVSTALPNPVIFEITSDTTVAGERQQIYKWTKLATDTITVDRRDFGASVLPDGRVLATGGHDSTNAAVVAPGNAWDILVYNKSPGDNYIVSGTMPAALGAHGQCVMNNGKALISGGWTTAWTNRLKASYIMDVDAFSWTAAANMKDARLQHELIKIDNRVIAVGGRQSNVDPNDLNNTILNSCEIYSTTGNAWTRTGAMTYARFGFGSVTLPDGRIIVVGGIGYNPTRTRVAASLNSTEIYDPNTGFWTVGPTMAVARDWPTVLYVASLNSVFVMGGFGSGTVEILDLEKMKWRRAPALLTAANLYRSQAGLAGPDTIVIIGGNDKATLSSTSKFNNVMVQNQDILWRGGINTIASVTSVPAANMFTYSTPDYVGYTSSSVGVVTAFKAELDTDQAPGPFIFDPTGGVSITSIFSTLSNELEKDQHYQSIEVADATVFPDEEGFLVFNFGFENSVAPVRYIGRLSNTELALDAGFEFPIDVEAGATVTLLKDRSPFVPARNEIAGNFWATDSASGRVAAENIIEDILAAGIDSNIKVIYPNDRGLGGEGFPTVGNYKLSDLVSVFGGNDLDSEIKKAQENQ